MPFSWWACNRRVRGTAERRSHRKTKSADERQFASGKFLPSMTRHKFCLQGIYAEDIHETTVLQNAKQKRQFRCGTHRSKNRVPASGKRQNLLSPNGTPMAGPFPGRLSHRFFLELFIVYLNFIIKKIFSLSFLLSLSHVCCNPTIFTFWFYKSVEK